MVMDREDKSKKTGNESNKVHDKNMKDTMKQDNKDEEMKEEHKEENNDQTKKLVVVSPEAKKVVGFAGVTKTPAKQLFLVKSL
jgi:hypothetical protein